MRKSIALGAVGQHHAIRTQPYYSTTIKQPTKTKETNPPTIIMCIIPDFVGNKNAENKHG
jgi:hypothetical protein